MEGKELAAKSLQKADIEEIYKNRNTRNENIPFENLLYSFIVATESAICFVINL